MDHLRCNIRNSYLQIISWWRLLQLDYSKLLLGYVGVAPMHINIPHEPGMYSSVHCISDSDRIDRGVGKAKGLVDVVSRCESLLPRSLFYALSGVRQTVKRELYWIKINADGILKTNTDQIRHVSSKETYSSTDRLQMAWSQLWQWSLRSGF